MRASSKRLMMTVSGVLLLSFYLINFAWGLYPFGGETLPCMLSTLNNMSFAHAAFIHAFVTSVIGIVAVTLLCIGRKSGRRF